MRKLTAWFLLTMVWFTSVVPFGVTAEAQIIGRTREARMNDLPNGLQFRLSEGSEGGGDRVVPDPAQADPLDPGAAEALTGRLPDIKVDPNDQTEFAKRVGTLPAPKKGERVPVKFPADSEMRPPETGGAKRALEVVRFSPEGEVALAPDLSITFSQPMVAVTSQQEAAQFAPVEISPAVEGRWRWLGTKTLMFDTDKRFPMATRFTVRVPAGTKSATGEALQKDHTWTFTTPPPKVMQFVPGGSQTVKRDAVMYVAFDQAITPEAVVRMIRVTAGGKRIPIRLVGKEEAESEDSTRYYISQGQEGRWVAFRAVNPDGSTENALPGNSVITVTVPKGTPSAEGPLTTTTDQSSTFRTYGPMNMTDSYCGWPNNKDCSPFTQWVVRFSNSIDGSKFTPDMVKITPAVEGAKIYPSGNSIYIDGVKKGRTTYKVEIADTLSDVFNQTLSSTAVATFRTTDAGVNLYAQGEFMSVLDPMSAPVFSIYTMNMQRVRVKVHRVKPEDWHQYHQFVRYMNYDDGDKRGMPGTEISNKVVAIENVADQVIETRIDLKQYLDNGLGNLVVDITPADAMSPEKTRYGRMRVIQWVQATKIGLDAFVDNTELVGFATELATGRPLGNVEMSIYPNGHAEVLQRADNGTEGSSPIGSIWDWVWSWGMAETGSTEGVDSDGSATAIETVEPTANNVTGPGGVVRLALAEPVSGKGPSLLIARRGNDTAFLPENSQYYWNENNSWYRKDASDTLRWFVFDDRKMYKPNEQVAVKGYLRMQSGGKLGDIEPVAAGRSYEWKASDPRGNEIAGGRVELNAFGAFDFKFSLPDNVNLGYASVAFYVPHDSTVRYTHQFQIQEFRRPEFEVTAKVDSEAPHFVGGSADLSVEAKYYAGGGLANAETNWTVTATPTSYTPPNRDDFTFGTWVPWWRYYGYGGGYSPSSTQYFQGVTDAEGKHHLKIDFESVKPARPYNISASASVQDVNRQAWAGQTTLLVHPADLYVGIKTPRTFVQKGENIHIDSIVTDIDGELKAGREIEIKAVLKDWAFEKGNWNEVTVDEQVCTVRSAEEPVRCSFVAKAGGRYTITATVMDDRERFNESEFTVWVPGGTVRPNRDVDQEEVQIIPSNKEFAPGDVAELLVIAPFSPAEGILTLRREGIVKTERFTIKDSSVTLKIPIEEAYLPNIHAQVDLVGAAERTDDEGEPAPDLAKRPAFAAGSINLSVSTESRKLRVSAEAAEKTLTPGGETKVAIEVTDHRGEPVANSEVAVVVVDESVLALTRYTIADPAAVFYSQRSPGTQDYHSRSEVLLGNPDDVSPPPPPLAEHPGAGLVSAQEMATMPSPAKRARMQMDGVEAAKAEDQSQIELRQNFDALAVFAPSVKTDSSGRATVDIKLPDNLTRYRITAVSVDTGKRFGKTESNITARKPLMVRPSAPRFMNFGDRIDLPVVVQNQTDEDMTVDIAVRGSNVRLSGGTEGTDSVSSTGKRVVVKANGREEVRFPASTVKAGTARFQIAVNSGTYTDAAEISLPVWTPATTEAFATYGTTDADGAIFQPVQTPGDVYPQFGGLEVTTSSTQLQELTDAFIYLATYKFECSEQIASRMISTAALRDVLSAFNSKDMPTAAELEARFAQDVKILQSRQRNDGSFGLWRRERERYEYPFLTVHVAHALALAKAKGYAVPDEMLNRTKPYLSNIENHLKDQWYISSPKVRWTISAYALYVREMIGDRDAGKAKKLLAEATIEEMPFEALGWVLSVLANDSGSAAEVEAITRYLLNRTTETAAAANFVTSYDDGGWLVMHSNRRADGVLLESFLRIRAGEAAAEGTKAAAEDLIPKLVRGLLAHRKKGHWGSTQENVFILLALDKYFGAYESVTPNFVTRIWLGDTYAGEQAFKGRSVDSNQLNIPMSYLVDQGGTSNLILDRQGAGRLYYRIGMKYAPTNLKLDPADYGFTVLRKYEAVDDPSEVVQNANGSWTIKSGARVRVRLTMVAQARRYHVALVDSLPAGLEILNPGLAVTEAIPPDTGGGNTGVVEVGSRSMGRNYYWWRANWFEHQNFRDERAEAFASLLWEGVYNYTYVTRATTPGTFVVPPAKAEEMYAPETFGRTGTDFVTVE